MLLVFKMKCSQHPDFKCWRFCRNYSGTHNSATVQILEAEYLCTGEIKINAKNKNNKKCPNILGQKSKCF